VGAEPWTPQAVLTALERRASAAVRNGYARFALPREGALGVAMKDIQALARQVGRHHELADPLWDSGVYEARLLVAYVADPARLTVAQMDRWCRDFDNWGVVDTLCFALFDRSPLAWGRVAAWARRGPEFEKRAAFALLWALALHDRTSGDAKFLEGLRRIEAAAADDRPYVKKALHMALCAIGKRNTALNRAALAAARRLAEGDTASARSIGRTAARELTSPAARRRLAARDRGSGTGA
jgi:3-methyladenine DNA glycosylase AlkD